MYIEDMENDSKEFEVKEQLEKERKDIHSFDDLVTFLQRVKDNCNTGYGTAPRAIAQAALAVAWYLASDFGITGFQAGFVMWDFIRDWQYRDNKCGLKIVDYDNMLYPQYDYKFEKIINKDIFKALQEEAWNLYNNETKSAHQRVEKHWESIIHGKVKDE